MKLGGIGGDLQFGEDGEGIRVAFVNLGEAKIGCADSGERLPADRGLTGTREGQVGESGGDELVGDFADGRRVCDGQRERC